jgi:hypothetical protein
MENNLKLFLLLKLIIILKLKTYLKKLNILFQKINSEIKITLHKQHIK